MRLIYIKTRCKARSAFGGSPTPLWRCMESKIADLLEERERVCVCVRERVDSTGRYTSKEEQKEEQIQDRRRTISIVHIPEQTDSVDSCLPHYRQQFLVSSSFIPGLTILFDIKTTGHGVS